MEFEDYIWRDLHSAELVEGVINSRFLVQTTAGLPLTVENLPKVQARKIYAFAQQIEEFVREERRVQRLFDDTERWVRDALSTERQPFLQVIAVLCGAGWRAGSHWPCSPSSLWRC